MMSHVEDSPFKLISILYRKSHIWLNSGCERVHLTAAQAVVIMIVCDFRELTQDEITKRLSLDKSVVAKTVSKLEDGGYLLRVTNKKDKRTYDIHPTDKAWAVYPAIREEVERCIHRMTLGLSQEEQVVFRQLLAKAAQAALKQED